ncbi:nucleolar and coiled-body phosphoprotein 1-like [Neltuma alba]|uniref:nucleolar and coiled-body phosphoprotein 1-like n=1 Tax=Neltuma alba TaxID=207710 RepID=UPI0010A52CF0|nr:nucleolar and coiled-body phosphoprotein 1-like [Prosopis alba]
MARFQVFTVHKIHHLLMTWRTYGVRFLRITCSPLEVVGVLDVAYFRVTFNTSETGVTEVGSFNCCRQALQDGEDNLIVDMENKKNFEALTNGLGPESKVTSEDKVHKKKKWASESLYNAIDESAEAKTMIDETKKRSKDKRKKKDKSSSDGNDGQFESIPMVTEVKLRDNASSDAKTVNGEMEKQSKDKKKRRNKSSSDGNVEGLQIGDHIENDSKKDSFNTANDDATGKKKKDSKKRRPTSEENDVLPVDGKADINGDLGNTGERSSVQRPQKKQQKGSVEPKVGKAFQRVKADEVVFADERIQDNSYWAKDGAESGYGAKAEEILGQVRGRDFRHEKTKKKRGTYKGGQIDIQSHSINFSDSDDDE